MDPSAHTSTVGPEDTNPPASELRSPSFNHQETGLGRAACYNGRPARNSSMQNRRGRALHNQQRQIIAKHPAVGKAQRGAEGGKKGLAGASARKRAGRRGQPRESKF